MAGPAHNVPGVESTVGVEALARMDLGPQDAIVVATMNRYDEVALEAVLRTVSGTWVWSPSCARADSVVVMLRDRGIDEAALGRVHTPAGPDLGLSSQEEIGLAIMAEIVNGGITSRRWAGGRRRALRVRHRGSPSIRCAG